MKSDEERKLLYQSEPASWVSYRYHILIIIMFTLAISVMRPYYWIFYDGRANSEEEVKEKESKKNIVQTSFKIIR